MTTISRLKKGLILIGATLIVTGCATTRENIADAGKVTVEAIDSQRTEVANVRVYEEAGEVIVTGKLRRKGFFTYAGEGHVDITIVGSDGQTIQQVSHMYAPHHITRFQSGSFKVRIPGDLPEKSTIRVAHHPGHHSHN